MNGNPPPTPPIITGAVVQPQALFRTLPKTPIAPPNVISPVINQAPSSVAEAGLPPTNGDPPPTLPIITAPPMVTTRSLTSDTDDAKDSHPIPTSAVAPVPVMSDGTHHTLHDEDIISSDDDNMHGHSNDSSAQVTPAKKRARFTSRTSTRSLSSSQTSAETSVLSCQLALLAALTAEMESSADTFRKEQWQTRIFQINQIMQMVQWEANGLYGLAENN